MIHNTNSGWTVADEKETNAWNTSDRETTFEKDDGTETVIVNEGRVSSRIWTVERRKKGREVAASHFDNATDAMLDALDRIQ